MYYTFTKYNGCPLKIETTFLGVFEDVNLSDV
jgi:hypothetical protein